MNNLYEVVDILHEAANHLIAKHKMKEELETSFLEGVTQIERALQDQIPSYQLDWLVNSILAKDPQCKDAAPYLKELVNII